MNMQEIRAIAKSHKVDITGMPKIDIIRTVQREEGNFECFATAYDGVCDRTDCLWREDCFEASKG